MTLVWFTPPQMPGNLDETLTQLHVLGVRWRTWRRSAPSVVYSLRDGVLVAEVGIITVTPSTGEIEVWPYDGIGPAEASVLAGCALRAFEQPPSKSSGWRYTRRRSRPRWQAPFFVRVDEHGGVGELVARHAQTMRQATAARLEQSFSTPAALS